LTAGRYAITKKGRQQNSLGKTQPILQLPKPTHKRPAKIGKSIEAKRILHHPSPSPSSIMAGGHGAYKILGRNISSQYVLNPPSLIDTIDM